MTARAGLGMTIWTAMAYQKDANHRGLIQQRGLIVVYWSWIIALGLHLVMDPPR